MGVAVVQSKDPAALQVARRFADVGLFVRATWLASWVVACRSVLMCAYTVRRREGPDRPDDRWAPKPEQPEPAGLSDDCSG